MKRPVEVHRHWRCYQIRLERAIDDTVAVDAMRANSPIRRNFIKSNRMCLKTYSVETMLLITCQRDEVSRVMAQNECCLSSQCSCLSTMTRLSSTIHFVAHSIITLRQCFIINALSHCTWEEREDEATAVDDNDADDEFGLVDDGSIDARGVDGTLPPLNLNSTIFLN